MQIYALALPFIFFRAFMSKWLVLQEHYWLSVGSQGLGAVTAVVGGYLLIRHYAVGDERRRSPPWPPPSPARSWPSP